jgi:phosphoglycolate phosphatase-like HAD superfamily hydrolase
MSAKPLYIFDLDGTLADCQHRTPILSETDDPNRWRRFYAACHLDAPIWPVIQTMERLRQWGAEIWIFSGRSVEVRSDTVVWLMKHTGFMRSELETALTMRDEGDFRADDIVKGEWLAGMLEDDRSRLVAAFDDRDRVVAMWRAAGVPCFQVAPGDF